MANIHVSGMENHIFHFGDIDEEAFIISHSQTRANSLLISLQDGEMSN